MYQEGVEYPDGQPHITGGILGPGGVDVPEKYKEQPDQEEKIGKKINIKPGNLYEVFFKVENPEEFAKSEIKQRAKDAFKQLEGSYRLKLKSVEYLPNENKVKMRFLALETPGQNRPAGTKTTGQYQTASFFVGFTVASAAFLVIDLLSEVRLTFIGGRQVKEVEKPGGILGAVSSTLGKVGAAVILGGIVWAVLQWNESTG